MDDSKRVFKITKDDKEIELYVKNPSLQQKEESESVRLKAWNRAIKDGAILAEKLNEVLREQNIWNDEKETQQIDLQEELIETIRKIKRGGIKLSEARQLAIRIRQIRNELNLITMDKINYIDNCVEGIAQNKEFGYLVSQSVVYNEGRVKKYFDSYEDYINKSKDIDAFICSNKCAEIFYGSQDTSSWPENSFLKKYKFVDDKLRLINEDGHLIDLEGRLIDDAGNYVAVVDSVEVVVDKEGNQLPEVKVEISPFLDDSGNPIVEESENKEEETQPVAEQITAT